MSGKVNKTASFKFLEDRQANLFHQANLSHEEDLYQIDEISIRGLGVYRSADETGRNLHKLTELSKKKLSKYMIEVLNTPSVKEEIEEASQTNANTTVVIDVTKEKGLVVKVNTKEISVLNYQELKEHKEYKVFLTVIKSSAKYYSNLSLKKRKITHVNTQSDQDRKISRIKMKSFETYKEINESLNKSWFSRQTDLFISSTDIVCLISDFISLCSYLPADITVAFITIVKGLAAILFYFISFLDSAKITAEIAKIGRLSGIKKILKSIEGLQLLAGTVSAICAISIGILLFLVSIGVIKSVEFFMKIVKSILYAYIISNIFSLFSYIKAALFLSNNYHFRKSIHIFLNNSKLSEEEKVIAVCKYLKKRISISKNKKEKLKQKAKLKLRKIIIEENAEVNSINEFAVYQLVNSQENIAQLEDIYYADLSKLIKKQCEKLKKITSLSAVKELLDALPEIMNSLKDENADKQVVLSRAKDLIKNIDKASYRKFISDLGYFTASFLLLTIGNVFKIFSGPIGPIPIAIFYVLISLFYVIWDISLDVKKRSQIKRESYSYDLTYRISVIWNYIKMKLISNNKITGFIYNKLRQKEIDQLFSHVETELIEQ